MSIQKARVVTNEIHEKREKGIEDKVLSKYFALEDIWKPKSGCKECSVEYWGFIGDSRFLTTTHVKNFSPVYSVIDLNTGNSLVEIVSQASSIHELDVWGEQIIEQLPEGKKLQNITVNSYDSRTGARLWGMSTKGCYPYPKIDLSATPELLFLAGFEEAMVLDKEGNALFKRNYRDLQVGSVAIDTRGGKFLIATCDGQRHMGEWESHHLYTFGPDQPELRNIELDGLKNTSRLSHDIELHSLDDFLVCKSGHNLLVYRWDTMEHTGNMYNPPIFLHEGNCVKYKNLLFTNDEHFIRIRFLTSKQDPFCMFPDRRKTGYLQRMGDSLTIIDDAEINIYTNMFMEQLLLECEGYEPKQNLVDRKFEPTVTYPNIQKIKRFFYSPSGLYAEYNDTIGRVIGEKIIWEKEQVIPKDFIEFVGAPQQ